MSAVTLNNQTPDGAWPSKLLAWWTLLVFFIVAVLSYSDRLVLSLLVDPIRADLKLLDTEVALVQGLAFAMIYSVASLPFGRLADMVARRMVIVAGVIMWSLCTAACAYADGFGTLFAARIGVGIGEAAFAPAAVSMIADLFPPHRRGLAIGCLLTGMAVGSGAAIVIGGGLLEYANGGGLAALPLLGPWLGGVAPWRSVLLVLGLAGIGPVLLLLTLREPQRRRHGDEPTHLPDLKSVLAQFRLRAGVLLPLYLAVSLISAGDFAIQNWFPALLSRRFGYSPGDIAATAGTVSILIGGLGTIAGGLLSDRHAGRGGNRGRLSVAMLALLVGLGGGCIALAGSGGVAIALFAVCIFNSSIGSAVGITVLQNVVPNQMRGVGTALVSFCNVIMGLAVGTALPALLTDYLFRDPQKVGWSMSIVALTSGIAALLMLRRARNGMVPDGR